MNPIISTLVLDALLAEAQEIHNHPCRDGYYLVFTSSQAHHVCLKGRSDISLNPANSGVGRVLSESPPVGF
ncbi:Transcriptional regulator, IclR family [Crocosphaera watsonii WH 0402]|uniref:Transcriptional regulator, IclR family n=1 Tax=Crocosphaera watsonii WH 0402 TaxID=1284629 RepID=T2JQE6_CROWT|nr:Transcriptional regulator, IclR family [Crocosphaera watsonii WH 0402]